MAEFHTIVMLLTRCNFSDIDTLLPECLFFRLSWGKENRVPDKCTWRIVDRHGARRHGSSIRRKVWPQVDFSSFDYWCISVASVICHRSWLADELMLLLLLFRMAEPDPNHTLEERVVHWYFSQLDKNSSGDIGKKEIKPFKRFLRKKSKPKKCVKKFVEYCDISNDKALSLQELMGCLGVTKEEGELNSTTSNY